MSADLVMDTDLAARFGITVERLHRLRREKGWPCVKFSRTDFRFTPEQVDRIVAMQTVAPGEKAAEDAGSGLTKGSKARGSAA